MNTLLNIFSYSCPLLLAACGALFSEYAGSLALFLEGLISFSSYLTFFFIHITGSVILGITISIITSTLSVFVFALFLSKTKANTFIASIGMNLIFTAATSFFSNISFGTRGVLTSENIDFPVISIQIFSVIITIILLIFTFLFLTKTQKGIYFRVTGTNEDVLISKGISVELYKIFAWVICSFFACWAGILLTLRISSFVPNISSGKGWMALAAVFLGRKKIWKIGLFTLIFCIGDYLSISIQNYIPKIPSSLLLSLPYIIVLAIICTDKGRE